MQVKQIRYGLVVAVMAFLVAGCFSLGSPTPVPDPTETSDDELQIRGLLGAYADFAERHEWNLLAGLYDYPVTLRIADTMDADDLGVVDISDLEADDLIALELGFEEALTELLEDLGLEGKEPDVEFTLHPDSTLRMQMTFDMDNSSEGLILIPGLLFPYTGDDADPDSDPKYTVTLGNTVISGSGNTRQVTVPITIEITEDDDDGDVVMTATEILTVTRDSGNWKIKRHERVDVVDPR